jgi:hypothetical protein
MARLTEIHRQQRQTVNTSNPTSIGYGFWWGLWEGLGWLAKS